MPLPYRFDSSGAVAIIVRAVVLLLVVSAAGLLYSLTVVQDPTAAVGMVAIAAVAGYSGWLAVRTMLASRGMIDAEKVVVKPVRVWGIRLRGPAGTFARRQFKAVRIDLVPAPMEALRDRRERVSLVGRDGIPDILVARSEPGAGQSLGRALARALRLPVENLSVPC